MDSTIELEEVGGRRARHVPKLEDERCRIGLMLDGPEAMLAKSLPVRRRCG